MFLRYVQLHIRAALFGSSSSLLRLSLAAQTTVLFVMIVAKKMIMTLWKSDTVPQIKMWLAELTALSQRDTLEDQLSEFFDVWQPVLDHLSKHKVLSDWSQKT